MYLRLFWLALCTLSFNSLAEAATPSLAPQTLSSQLHIQRQDIGISEEDWQWLR